MSDVDDERIRPERGLGALLRDWLRGGRRNDDRLRDDLEELLDEHPSGENGGTSEERILLQNVLNVGDLSVGDVMVPRTDICAIPIDASFDQVVAQFIACGHSRLPVYRGSLDDTQGFVHVKDLLPYLATRGGFALAPITRKALFVPFSVPVLDLLLQMRRAGVHIALVVDEYGGVDGLVTIEDLVEQIVGEIRDEYDLEEGPTMMERSDGALDAVGRTPIDELVERFGPAVVPPDLEEEVDTLGGLVSALAGRIPRRGETIVHPGGMTFEVVDADTRRVKRIRIRAAPPTPDVPAV